MRTRAHKHSHPFQADMLSVEEALEKILCLTTELGPEDADLLSVDGQVLAVDVYSPYDIPSLPNSAMDGYAVQSNSLSTASDKTPITIKVIGESRAGDMPNYLVEPGNSVRIMTGAPLPDGADSVVPFEFTDEATRLLAEKSLDEITIQHAPQAGDHVRPAGEDVLKGTRVLIRGKVLDPPAIGALASMGYDRVRVVRKPRVAILATGDELQKPGEKLRPGNTYDINSFAIATLVSRYGGLPSVLGVAKDNLKDLRTKLKEATKSDLLITSAGVSRGKYDMVKDVLAEMGSISFWSVRMRPSRPLAFGTLLGGRGRKIPHLGLPGNPVSAMVAMVEFGRPLLAKMMGRVPEPLPVVTAVMNETIENADGRRVYMRVTLEDRNGVLYANLSGAQGSNLLTSLVWAQGLAICPENISEISAGELADVQLLDWLDPTTLSNLMRKGKGNNG